MDECADGVKAMVGKQIHYLQNILEDVPKLDQKIDTEYAKMMGDGNHNEQKAEGNVIVQTIASIRAQSKALHAMVDKRESDLIARVHIIKDRNVKILAEQKSNVEQVIRQSHAVVTSVSE